jgi:hypothetical protein
MFAFSASGITTGQTIYFSAPGPKATAESVAQRTYMPYGATITQMYVQTTDVAAGAGSAVTLLDNGGSPTMTCTITSGNSGCNDVNPAHSVSVTAGHGYDVSFHNSSANTLAIGILFRMTGLPAGKQLLQFSYNTGTAAGASSYWSNPGLGAATSSSVTRTGSTIGATVESVYATSTQAAGVAGSPFALQIAGTPGLATCTILNTAFTCNATGLSVSIADANALDVRVTNSGGSTSFLSTSFGLSGEGTAVKMALFQGNILAGSTTSYFTVLGVKGTIESAFTEVTSSITGTVVEMRVQCTLTAGAGGSKVVLRDITTGGDTLATCTVLQSQSACVATSLSVVLTKGDLIDFSFANSNASSVSVGVALGMTGVS